MTTENTHQEATHVPLNAPLDPNETLAAARTFYADNHEETTGEPLGVDEFISIEPEALMKLIADAFNQQAL